MIDALIRLTDFLGAYPSWVKYTVLALLALMVFILIAFRPANQPGWKIQVYHFRNWSESAEKGKFGERFSGLVLDALLKMDLDARREMSTGPVSFDVVASRSEEPERLDEAYKAMAPFISVAGFVEDSIKGTYVVHARVSAIHQNLRIRTLVVEELQVGSKDSDMRAKADALAKVIFDEVDSLAKRKAA